MFDLTLKENPVRLCHMECRYCEYSVLTCSLNSVVLVYSEHACVTALLIKYAYARGLGTHFLERAIYKCHCPGLIINNMTEFRQIVAF